MTQFTRLNEDTVKIQCRRCKKEISIDGITEGRLMLYEAGGLMQDVFPEVSLGDRELLISGVCGPCFNEMFSGR